VLSRSSVYKGSRDIYKWDGMEGRQGRMKVNPRARQYVTRDPSESNLHNLHPHPPHQPQNHPSKNSFVYRLRNTVRKAAAQSAQSELEEAMSDLRQHPPVARVDWEEQPHVPHYRLIFNSAGLNNGRSGPSEEEPSPAEEPSPFISCPWDKRAQADVDLHTCSQRVQAQLRANMAAEPWC
jgi:hypothetical protein